MSALSRGRNARIFQVSCLALCSLIGMGCKSTGASTQAGAETSKSTAAAGLADTRILLMDTYSNQQSRDRVRVYEDGSVEFFRGSCCPERLEAVAVHKLSASKLAELRRLIEEAKSAAPVTHEEDSPEGGATGTIAAFDGTNEKVTLIEAAEIVADAQVVDGLPRKVRVTENRSDAARDLILSLATIKQAGTVSCEPPTIFDAESGDCLEAKK